MQTRKLTRAPEGGDASHCLPFWDRRGWRTEFSNAQDTGFPAWPVPIGLCDLPHHSVLSGVLE